VLAHIENQALLGILLGHEIGHAIER